MVSEISPEGSRSRSQAASFISSLINGTDQCLPTGPPPGEAEALLAHCCRRQSVPVGNWDASANTADADLSPLVPAYATKPQTAS